MYGRSTVAPLVRALIWSLVVLPATHPQIIQRAATFSDRNQSPVTLLLTPIPFASYFDQSTYNS
jgi:hypothetical protein